jgi:hypothetical protein
MLYKGSQKQEIAAVLQDIIGGVLDTAELKMAALPGQDDFKSQENFWTRCFRGNRVRNFEYFPLTLNFYAELAFRDIRPKRSSSGQNLEDFIANIVSEDEVLSFAYSYGHPYSRRTPFDLYRFFCSFASQEEIDRFKSLQEEHVVEFNQRLLKALEDRNQIYQIQDIARQQQLEPLDLIKYMKNFADYFRDAPNFQIINDTVPEFGWDRGTNMRLIRTLNENLTKGDNPFNAIEYAASRSGLPISEVSAYVLNNPDRFKEAKNLSVIFGMMSKLTEQITKGWVRTTKDINLCAGAYLRDHDILADLTPGQFGNRLREIFSAQCNQMAQALKDKNRKNPEPAKVPANPLAPDKIKIFNIGVGTLIMEETGRRSYSKRHFGHQVPGESWKPAKK